MLYTVHRSFAVISFLTILTFFVSTIIAELLLNLQSVVLVKSWIVFPGLFILIPAIAITAITGNILAKKSKKAALIATKKRRMPLIALNGIVILIPSAIYLNILASNAQFDVVFYGIQALELIAGATNLVLMFMNIQDSKKAKQS
jgi:hypothetical protein